MRQLSCVALLAWLVPGSAWAGMRIRGDYIDIDFNDSGTWNDDTGLGFKICDGSGTCADVSYPGSPWQVLTVAYSLSGSTYSYTGQ